MSDLLSFIDWSGFECLNGKTAEHAIKQGYREDDKLLLVSEVDEQLLIQIQFTESVKISSISMRSNLDISKAPKTVKLFVNRPHLGFQDASDVAPTQEIEFTEEMLQGEEVPLRVVKFAKVSVLTIFVESNQGDEETTCIQKISLTGTGGGKMDVSSIKDISKD